MSSEGCREASGFEAGKGAVRERTGLARQPRHSGMQGTQFSIDTCSLRSLGEDEGLALRGLGSFA